MDLPIKGDSPKDGQNLTYHKMQWFIVMRVDEGRDNNYLSLLIFYIVEKVQMKMKPFVILYSIFIKSFKITTFCIV
jgi:hypothetical protein